MTQRSCSDYVEDMAATMLATTQGIDLDPDKAYNERKEIYQAKGLVVRTRAAVQTVEGDKNGLWTSAIAAAVCVSNTVVYLFSPLAKGGLRGVVRSRREPPPAPPW